LKMMNREKKMEKKINQIQKTRFKEEKILLMLLPFWAPLIPPLGIASLKSYLQPQGFDVKVMDVNVEKGFKDLYDNYYETMKGYIPTRKRGNFYNICQTVLRNHMMAFCNFEQEEPYNDLLKILVYQTFFTELDKEQLNNLDTIIKEFYQRLENYLKELLEREKPTVLGISVYVDTLPASLFTFKLTRRLYPEIKTVIGGGIFVSDFVLGTPNFEYFLEKSKDYVDKVIVGEGEELFLKLLKNELPETQRVFSLKDIDGEILDISTVGLPDFRDLELHYYPYMAAYTSRSCPFNCSFCSETVLWGKYRKMEPRLIVEQMHTLYKEHENQLFLMCDSLLNPVMTALSQELIDSGHSFYWDGYLRVANDVCDPDIVHTWRKGGFYRARLGIESGSPKVLELMSKKITIDKVKTAIYTLANAGIKTSTYWIAGHPGETEEDFQLTLDLITELKDCIYEAECNPFLYYFNGQSNSDEWSSKFQKQLLYPEKYRDMLFLQTWILNTEPSREVIYQRLNRFVEHCDKLGVPNPYFLYDIYHADERWKKLHKNSVPCIVEFKNLTNMINENLNIKKLHLAQNPLEEEDEFDF
jgi:radical SAM superfamily enzyme YgiQ (UPF0313 family)